MLRRAYAKLNLALSVGPGDHECRMHPIASWMHPIDLFDEVRVEHRPGEARGASRRPARESLLEVAWAPDAPVQSEIDWGAEQDLSVRALRMLEAHIHEPLPVRIHITKRIPVGGGLGGGSSDAAAVLILLNELFALGLKFGELSRLSRGIGSDVSFFIDSEEPPRPAFVTGFGHLLERRARHADEVVLILPPFACATREVYAAFDRTAGAELREAEVDRLSGEATIPVAGLFNDLAPAAERVRPELLRLRARLAAAVTDPIHLTGSGSTLFAITRDPVGVARQLEAAAPGAAILRTRLV